MVPVRHEFCEWKLVDIDFAPKFSEADWELSQPIAEETRVSMQDDLLSYYIWKDGKIEFLAPYREPAAKASGASGKGQ